MRDLQIAYIQTDLHWEDKQANLANLDRLLSEVQAGTDLILLPETFNTAFPVNPVDFAESQGGPTWQWMMAQAAERNAVICGTFLLQVDGKYRNSLVWMRPDGSSETYYKRHPFSIGGENRMVERGDKELIVSLNGWRVKPMICYDMRFPVWARNRYRDGEYAYDLGLYLANFPDSRMVVWNTLLVARAIENQAFFAGVNRIGDDPHGLHYSGDSQIVNARGEVVSRIESYREGVGHCTLRYDGLQQFRQKFPLGPDWDSFDIQPI